MIVIDLDKPRHLRFTPRAMIEAEEHLGMGAFAALSPQYTGVKTLRTYLWAGLKHEDPLLTLEKVEKLMEDYLTNSDQTSLDLENKVKEALQEGGWYRTPKVADTKNGEL